PLLLLLFTYTTLFRSSPPLRGILQPVARAPAPPLRRRPGLHGFFRLAPGCHQEGLRGAAGRRAVGSTVPAHRPGRPGPQLRRRPPRRQAVRPGRRVLPARTGTRPEPAAPAAK